MLVRAVFSILQKGAGSPFTRRWGDESRCGPLPCLGILYNLSPVYFYLSSNLGKGMATCSSIRAWKIPWTEEPGGLHRVHGVTKSQTRLSD